MILKPDSTRNTVLYFILVFLAAFLYWITFPGFTFQTHWYHYMVIAVWIIPAVVFYLLALKMSCVILTDKELIQRRLMRESRLPYSDVAYIDEETSRKGRNLCLITHDKKPLMITMDKEKVLLDEMLNRCHNRPPIRELIERDFFPRKDEKR